MPIPAPGGEPQAWLALELTPGLGGEGMRKLLARFGAPSAVLAQSITSLSQFVSSAVARAIALGPSADKIDACLKWLEGESNHLLTLSDADYPPQLLEITDPPPVLYLKGRRELLGRPDSPSSAVVMPHRGGCKMPKHSPATYQKQALRSFLVWPWGLTPPRTAVACLGLVPLLP